MSKKTETIILGSGKLFVTEFTGEIPDDQTIETEENRLGYVKNGASVEYAPTFVTEKDDLGYVQKTILTEEEATLKSGLITFDGNALTKLSATARVSETETKRTTKIGGVGNDDGKKYLIRFLHEDAVDGDIRVTVVGRNEAGFTLSFAKDSATVIDAEFKAHPMDGEGTLIQYDEEIKGAA